MVFLLGNQLGKLLATSVRSIMWSYSIFWSPLLTNQEGVLQWSDGYFNVDKVDLKKSDKLKDMYKSLSVAGETNEQAQIPASSTSLTPGDLSEAEWYYVLCMSYEFAPGEGLPGRAFENGEHIWLCNAQDADSQIFSRSLLAKSASIQTVVCFPVSGGVVELGATDMVMEDLNLLQQMKSFFLDFKKHSCIEKFISSYPPKDEDDESVLVACESDHQKITKSGLRCADTNNPGSLLIMLGTTSVQVQ